MDVFSPEKRSQVMAQVRSQDNKSTEVAFERLLRQHKIRGWRTHYPSFGNPDFAIPALKIALFVDGAFWHGHPDQKMPENNSEFWIKKIGQNKKRDRKVNRHLRDKGWTVIRFWDFDVKKQPFHCVKRLRRIMTMKSKARSRDE